MLHKLIFGNYNYRNEVEISMDEVDLTRFNWFVVRFPVGFSYDYSNYINNKT